jgi:hypothetical protein
MVTDVACGLVWMTTPVTGRVWARAVAVARRRRVVVRVGLMAR